MKKISIFLIIFISINLSSQEAKTYPKNNLTIKPFNANSVGIGIGVQFERYLDNTNNFSLVIPIDYSFEVANNDGSNLQSNDNYGYNINPGVRFYFVEPRNFNWYLGTSFFYGVENNEFRLYDPLGRPYTEKGRRTSFGTMVNIGFKGTIKGKFTYNVESGLGIKFIEKFSSNNFNYARNRGLASFLVGFGYNF